jgi:hypothetical protein
MNVSPNVHTTPTEIVATLPAVPSGGGQVPEFVPSEPKLPAVAEPQVRELKRTDAAAATRIYPPKIAKAILAVTREIGRIAKNGENEFQRYKYPRWEDINEKLSPLLAEHGLITVQTEKSRHLIEQNDKGSMLSIVYGFSFTNEDGDCWPEIEWTALARLRDQKGISDDKAAAKCHTQAEKYFCIKQFKIRTADAIDSDADGPQHHGENDRPAIPADRRPTYVVPPPSRALKPGGIAERAIGKRYEQAVRSVGPSQPFPASEAGKAFSPRFRAQAAGYDERNPPPDDVIPDGPGEAAKALNRCLHPMKDELPGDLGPPKVDHTDHGGIPAFCDRRKANGSADDAAEASYVDLVTGGGR